jgi:glycosyltransferase involved in cell wall biosynthesis
MEQSSPPAGRVVAMPGRHVHVSLSPLVHASRVLKITDSLVRNGIAEEIVLFGLSSQDLPREESWDDHRRVVRLEPRFHQKIPRGKSLALYLEWYAQVTRSQARGPVAVAHSNGLFDLPACIGLKLRFGCPVVYDAHELETEVHGLSGSHRALAKVLERALIRFADEIIVVNNSIADWYRRTYGRRVTVVRNKPRKTPVATDAVVPLRTRLGLDERDRIFLCHGALQANRSITRLIEAFRRLPPNQRLVFVGFGPLVPQILDATRTAANIHLLEPVPSEHVVQMAATADVGLAVYEASCLSNYYSLPNKLFEYELAGLPVIVSDFPELAGEVDRWGNGWKVRPDVEALVAIIGSMTEAELAKRREGSSRAALAATWDSEEPALLRAYENLYRTRPLTGRAS